MRCVNTLVIGNGISAKAIIYYLNKIGLKDILQVFDDSRAPACSTRSTAINCLRGTRPNLTALGDRIINSFNEFENFNNENHPAGITLSSEYQTWENFEENNIRWRRRYKVSKLAKGVEHFNKSFKTPLNIVKNKAYIITPEKLFDWFDSKNTRDLLDGFVESILIKDGVKEVLLGSGEIVHAQNIIICTSYNSANFSELVKDEVLKKQLNHSKAVPGTYIKFKGTDFDSGQIKIDESFVFAFENMYFIYRKEDDSILFGATSTNNKLSFDHNEKDLKQMYDRFHTEFSGVLNLPSFELGTVFTGVRHKGQNRQPYWGEINDGVYAAWGLYKNAFTFSFSAAASIADSICNDLER